jgi:hypothetical protein
MNLGRIMGLFLEPHSTRLTRTIPQVPMMAVCLLCLKYRPQGIAILLV